MKLHITEDVLEKVQVARKEDLLELQIDERVNAMLFVTYDGLDAKQRVNILLQPGSKLKVLLKNNSTSDIQLDIEAFVHKDAFLEFAYCDLDPSSSTIDGMVHLCEEGANCDIKSACIVEGKKHFKVAIEHATPYTTGTMEHYAVVKEHGNYHMEAIGKINKGAHDSVSHQTTRVLTMSEQHNSEVVPLLLIDENDVKASHATTLGQPDANQLYYLQTRGLTREQALGLLSVGYIMPIAQMFDHEEWKNELKNEIEMKVGLHA
ncbi:MAG: SufD family Fe-S cluster assembly protein [Longicatena sp.]